MPTKANPVRNSSPVKKELKFEMTARDKRVKLAK
jgi:hypothetical protein